MTTTLPTNSNKPASHDPALLPSTEAGRPKVDPRHIQTFVENLFGGDLHAKRVLSLANGVVGVLHAAVLAIHAIGQAYAKVAKITPKSGVKQIDRLLSNTGLDLSQILKLWVAFVIGVRKEIVIALDWTDFEKDDHTTLAAYLVTRHGRATPLVWKTVKKSTLQGTRNNHEYEIIERLHEYIDKDVRITLLADRGFGDQKLYDFMQLLGWDFVIRFRGCIVVENAAGESRAARAWVPASGRATMLRKVRVTGERASVPAVVLVRAPKMKEAWCLATTLSVRKASEIVKLYSKRFTIEETFRDEKNLHFGMGLSATHIQDARRRDRLLLLAAIAHALLTLLGAAAEEAGLDRFLKVNTVKRRTHSLFRQGAYWYDCIPTMREEWLRPLMIAFDRIVREQAVLPEIFGII
jgi:hypothetical protein